MLNTNFDSSSVAFPRFGTLYDLLEEKTRFQSNSQEMAFERVNAEYFEERRIVSCQKVAELFQKATFKDESWFQVVLINGPFINCATIFIPEMAKALKTIRDDLINKKIEKNGLKQIKSCSCMIH
ncbi:MAG: hypothetical protein WCP39_04155 [Chlamydiota bacterium]